MDRPGLAIIANCVTPYRINLHRLVAEGIPELKLHTLITHGAADFDWNVNIPPSIHLSHFGSAEDSPLAGTFHSPLREWRKGGQLIQYLKDNDVHAVIMNNYRYVSSLRVIDYCYRHAIPLFGRNDSNIRCERFLPAWKQWLKTRVYRWWIPRTAGIMSMGEYGDQFFQKYGADPTHIYRVPYWPDYEAFASKSEEQLEQFRRKFGLRTDRRYLLYSGRLVPKKRVDLLIEAFMAVADKRREWDLLIVGDGILREQLREAIPDELKSRVIWTGFLQQLESIVAFGAADALVLPSDQEPWGLVIQEAIAAGVPVIASDVVGAAKEIVEDYKSGRIFPSGDRQALIESILDITDPASIAQYQQQTLISLATYRKRVDPVAEIRRALEAHCVLGA